MISLALKYGQCFIEAFFSPLGQTFFGFLLGIAFALILERNRKPKLLLELKPTDNHTMPSPFRSVGVTLVNRKPNRWAAWFTYREPAMRASLTINFLSSDHRPFIERPMQGRWTSSPQPPELPATPYNQMALQFHEIYPGVDEGVDIAVRFAQEEECYGFSNASYRPGPDWGRDPNFRLLRARYIVQVSVNHSGGTITENFLLRNDLPASEFRLETE